MNSQLRLVICALNEYKRNTNRENRIRLENTEIVGRRDTDQEIDKAIAWVRYITEDVEIPRS